MAGNTTMKGNTLDKGCVRTTVTVVGILLFVSWAFFSNISQVLAIFSMWLGLEANYCTELTLLELNKKVSYVLMIAAMMLFLTAAFGWTAAATKNDCLSYCVSAVFFN